MNFVFVTILIFLILIPGFLFRFSYFSSPFSKRFTASNLVNDLTWSIIPGLLIHSIGTLIVENYTNYDIKYDHIGYLLLSVNDKQIIATVFNNINEYLFQIILYNISLLLVSIIIGHLGKMIIRKYRFDRKYRLLRFSNKWHYILTGECLDFPHIKDSYADINFKVVDVLCQIGNEPHIYIGELFDWYSDDLGNLDSIHLRNPYRRKMSSDSEDPKKRYYKIPTRFLIIPYKSIININARYFHVKIEKSK
jgi:hypothetical protein